MDEPVFFAEDTSEVATHFDVPAKHHYVGSVPEGSIDPVMPTIYLQWEVAKRLQFEAQRSIQVDLEVAGILLGTRSADDSVIKVSHIAVAKDEDSSPVHFKFSYSVWDDLIDQMEELSNEAGEELLLLGWYHTHPGFGIFLSDRDQFIQQSFFDVPYQVAVVYDPKSREHGLFTWRDGKPTRAWQYWIGERSHRWQGVDFSGRSRTFLQTWGEADRPRRRPARVRDRGHS